MERHKEIKKSSLIKNDSKYESAIKKIKMICDDYSYSEPDSFTLNRFDKVKEIIDDLYKI